MTTILTELTPEQARFLIDSGQFPELATALNIKLEAAENNGLTKDYAAQGLFVCRRIFPSPDNDQVKLLERVLLDFAAVYTDENLGLNIAHSLIPDRCQWLRPIVIETLCRVHNTKRKVHYKAQIEAYLGLYLNDQPTLFKPNPPDFPQNGAELFFIELGWAKRNRVWFCPDCANKTLPQKEAQDGK